MTVQMQSRNELMAAVDLGSNSFRLLIAKEDGGQIIPVSMYREGVRLAGGLSDANELLFGSNRISKDSDGDGIPDGVETNGALSRTTRCDCAWPRARSGHKHLSCCEKSS